MGSRSSKPQLIAPLVEKILSEKGYLTFFKEYSIIYKWHEIVDKKFAEVSTCERVEKGIVYVKVISAPWRQEAAYRKKILLTRIQKEFGCPTIKDIIFY